MRRELRALGEALVSAGARMLHSVNTESARDMAVVVTTIGSEIAMAMNTLDREDATAWADVRRREEELEASMIAATQRQKAEDEAMGRVSLSAKIRKLMGMEP